MGNPSTICFHLFLGLLYSEKPAAAVGAAPAPTANLRRGSPYFTVSGLGLGFRVRKVLYLEVHG